MVCFAYFLLILLSPFITIGIKALGQRKLFTFLLIFGFFWSVIPTLTTKPEYYGSTLFWFVYLFSWGAFLRDYLERKIFSQSLCLSVCGASWGIIAIIIALADWNNRVGTFIGYIDWFTFANLYSVSLICALSLLCSSNRCRSATSLGSTNLLQRCSVSTSFMRIRLFTHGSGAKYSTCRNIWVPLGSSSMHLQ